MRVVVPIFILLASVIVLWGFDVGSVSAVFAREGFSLAPPSESGGEFSQGRIIAGIAGVYILFTGIVWWSSRAILKQAHEIKSYADRLAESLKKEKELSAVKDQFITMASHQLNTPISVIKWTAELMGDKTIARDLKQNSLPTIAQAADELASIVADILTVSEIGFRYEKRSAATLNLLTLTHDTVSALARHASMRGVGLEVKNTASDAAFLGDAFAMKKVLENLIQNAIHYSNGKGVVAIEISETNGLLRWAVRDNGIGISKEEQSRIFEKFFRAKNAVERKNVGTGLGLFIAKTIVEGHGGTIGFESEEGKGSTFYFTVTRNSHPVSPPAPAKKE